ncbi:MAG: hypothetical protein IJF61_05075 [Clostridia bacterium]|nr:hypothetical protein [Clostridia bacterium]
MHTNFDEKMLLARIGDLERGAEHGGKPCFSRFLDPKEIAVFNKQPLPKTPFMLWGGYEDSERKILGFFPDYLEPDPALFPIRALRITSREPLGHRTVLGSVMGLGIERNLIGDVAMETQGAVLFACDSICDYIKLNLTKAGRAGIKIQEALPESLELLPKAWEPICGTVASLRLDCVLGLLTGASRNGAEEMLKQERVLLNHTLCKKSATLVNTGDVLSVRGFGRAELLEIGGETRKGRMKITLKKYI